MFLVLPGGEGWPQRRDRPLLYRHGDGAWVEIETISWVEALRRSDPMPRGWYHVRTDIGTMTGSAQAGPGGEAGIIRDRPRRSVPLRVEGTSLVLAEEPRAPGP